MSLLNCSWSRTTKPKTPFAFRFSAKREGIMSAKVAKQALLRSHFDHFS